MADRSQWYVTVMVDGDPRRTCDHLVAAHSEWSAGWLYRQLHPTANVIRIRPAR